MGNCTLALDPTRICSQNSLGFFKAWVSQGVGNIPDISGPCWNDSIGDLLYISQLYILWISCSITSRKVLCCIRVWWLGRPLKHINLVVVFREPVWCIIMLDAAVRSWVKLWPSQDARGQQQFSDSLWHSNNAVYPKKTWTRTIATPPPSPPTSAVDARHVGICVSSCSTGSAVCKIACVNRFS